LAADYVHGKQFKSLHGQQRPVSVRVDAKDLRKIEICARARMPLCLIKEVSK
jgi:hypothetical protein